MSIAEPRLSVIVPAYQAAAVLEHCLKALGASDLPRQDWELIVVDDGSTDETVEIVRCYADQVLSLPGKPRGPSYARNRGSEVARGAWLVFVDADVCVHTDTLRRFVDSTTAWPEVAAVFGSYDDKPRAGGVASKYRNLLHHWVHQHAAGDAETFWAGCGAVRRDVFEEVGMFDEWHFWRPQIEDIELGRRMRRHGHRIVLQPDIQAEHLKRWTLREILATDFVHRGVPWIRLIIQEGTSAGSRALNLRPIEKWCTALAGVGVVALIGTMVWATPWPLLVAGGAFAFIVGTHIDFYALIRRRCGWRIAAASVPLHLVHYLGNAASTVWGWLVHTVVGPPLPSADVAAFDELGVDAWPPVPARPKESLWQANEH